MEVRSRGCFASHFLIFGMLCAPKRSRTTWRSFGGKLRRSCFKKLRKRAAVRRLVQACTISPVATFIAAYKSSSPWRSSSCVYRAAQQRELSHSNVWILLQTRYDRVLGRHCPSASSARLQRNVAERHAADQAGRRHTWTHLNAREPISHSTRKHRFSAGGEL